MWQPLDLMPFGNKILIMPMYIFFSSNPEYSAYTSRKRPRKFMPVTIVTKMSRLILTVGFHGHWHLVGHSITLVLLLVCVHCSMAWLGPEI